MRRRIRNAFLLALPFVLLAGCSRTDEFTVMSTKTMNMVLLPDAYKGRYTGHDVRHILLIFPTGLPDMKRATDAALEDGNGNLLVNAQAYIHYWYIPLIYGQIAYVVKGEVYDVQATATESELEAEAREERYERRLREEREEMREEREAMSMRPGEKRTYKVREREVWREEP